MAELKSYFSHQLAFFFLNCGCVYVALSLCIDETVVSKFFLCALDLTVLLKEQYLPLELCWMSFKIYHLCVVEESLYVPLCYIEVRIKFGMSSGD